MNRETSMQASDTLIVVDRSRRRRNIIIAAAVAVAALLLAAYFFAGDKGASEEAAKGPGAGGGQIPTVSVVVPGTTQVGRTITASGALAARRDQPIGVAGEGGRVTNVYVDAGSWVGQGQVLASIDRSVQVQETAQLAASVQAARADAALAQNELERSQALVGRGFVSKADLDRKRAARDAAAARVRVAQAQLSASRNRVGRLDIRAPTAGLILSRSIEVGQIVSPGSGGLFRLARGGEMELRASLSQQDLAFVRVGMPASVTPIGTDRSFSGTIWQVAPIIDPQSRQGEVKIAIPYDPSVRPGGFAEARIGAGSSTAPLLPQSAVLSDEKGNYVYVVNAKNEIERRAVEIGSVDEQGVSIRSGLTGRESVVVSAGPFLNPGQKVAPRRSSAAAAR
ncbi:efflux RND transporter periplasmic adaptor subunit [Sphingomonas rhizophila]|uniref:Efflux RND transporter periplasmic adaptor subunit n=1 Tax=Sphingomonas rhizophila TaxID=2071607 RepID=A0A7G9SBG3_9SPHN|nr:efflux RND transporter periplasmic adaptor subunit [Sphingomonas rhizophila]QNN65188.1 efflux RND transporter periplasmic adaptor subunit [Sphingomonas rhizophila]